MLTRIITAVVGIPVIILIVLLGNPVLQFTMMGVSLVAAYEFYKAVKSSFNPMKYIGYVGIIVYYLFLNTKTVHLDASLGVLLVILLAWMVIKYPKYNIGDVGITLVGVLYTGLLFSFIVLIMNTQYGDFWIWLIMLSSWGSDTFAYFIGKGFGKHKLAPVLSPNKTVEGSIGGIIGAGVLGCIYTLIYTSFRYESLRHYVVLVVVSVMIAAIISQFGDLAASAMKRTYGIKDFGSILPGHGGIVDRFDSILFVAPIIYVAVVVAERIMS